MPFIALLRRAVSAAAIACLITACASSRTVPGPTAPTRAARAPTTPAAYTKEAGTMWTFDAPPLEYWKSRYGFTPDQAWLDHVRLASVRLPNCSASFVSAHGLVMSNHHCARECVTAVSPADTNYQATGFIASSPADEKKCPMLHVDQLESITDVTSQVRSGTSGKTPAEQVASRDATIARLQSECTRTSRLICQVVTLYQGGMYSLYRYRRYSDVRLVMVPEEQAAFFGGDPDNFTYPRYDLDLSLLRVYDNGRPLAPRDYLRWSAAGPKDSDLVFVTGNPGSTGRLLTVAQMEFLRDVQYPATLQAYDRALANLRQVVEHTPAAAREYDDLIFSLENSKKAVTGYRVGLLDSTIMARKRAFERDLRDRVAADTGLARKYGDAWDQIAMADRELAALAPRLRFYGFGGNPIFGSQLLVWAGQLVRIPQESAKPDSARLEPYRGPALAAMRAALLEDTPVNAELERLNLASYLRAAQRVLPPGDPYLQALLGGKTPEAAAEALVNGTKLADPATRRALLDAGAAAVQSSTDPMIVAARKIDPLNREVVARADRFETIESSNEEKVGQALFAIYGTKLPPDATFTLRISDGVVKGYPYNGTVAPWKTTFLGMFAHAANFDNTGAFQLPDRWWQRRDKLDLRAPLDIVTTNDIIGGNSGSPVINRDAEVVGLIFDGNIESLPNRFIFTDDVARAVAVDSRAITEALRGVYGASWLADELEGRTAARD